MARILRTHNRGIASGMRVDGKLTFVRCKACRRISREEDRGTPCPQCGAGSDTQPWPDSVGERLFKAVEDFFKRRDNELTVLLACDFLELLLGMFFRDVFVKQGRPPSWVQLTLRKNKSIDLRLRYLFKETLHLGFSSAIRGSPFEGFDQRWTMIRSTRGMLIHADPCAVDDKIAREAYALSRDALTLFAWLNNRYCV